MRLSLALGTIAASATHSEAVLGSPAMDNVGARQGALRKVAFSGTWGSKPYPVNHLNADPFTETADGAPASGGEFYTDLSEQGWQHRKALLDMHNYVRKLEAPAAKYMTKLIWDFHLEAYSRQWAQSLCSNMSPTFFDHSPNNQTGMPSWPFRISTGENLYTSTKSRPRDDDFTDVVTKWYAERDDFNWSTGRSNDASKPIGHWKQLVRPQATAVGCTIIGNCHTNGGSSAWKTFVVCHYDYGNIGTLPYEPGTGEAGLCQNCPSGFDCCEAGLCSGRSDQQSKSLAPYAPASQRTEDWYGCGTFKRNDCQNTGAALFSNTAPGDNSDLEFQQCSCSPNPLDFQDTVNHGYFYFRNQCFQATDGAGDDNSDVNSIYAMATQSSKIKPHEQVADLQTIKDGINAVSHSVSSVVHGVGTVAKGTGNAAWNATKFVGGTASDMTKNVTNAVKSTAEDIKKRVYVDREQSRAPQLQVQKTSPQTEQVEGLHVSLNKKDNSGPTDFDMQSARGVKLQLDQDDDANAPMKLVVKEEAEQSAGPAPARKTKEEAVKGDLQVPASLVSGSAHIQALKRANPPKEVGKFADNDELLMDLSATAP